MTVFERRLSRYEFLILMTMFFYAHENAKNTSSVLLWATLRDFVSSVMLAEFYLYISSYESHKL